MKPAGAEVAATKRPVLIIEDEPAVTGFLRAALERHGYAVAQAVTGAEGLRMLASGEFLGIISDVRTPGGVSGADVHAWIHEHKPELSARLVFITGDIANTETLAMLRRSGTPCVEKPFRVAQLLAVVEKTFGEP
jgi:DNA-binding response OmpR family regulator